MSRSILIILCVAAVASVPHANKNFIPDWTFTGSSLADAEQLGAAKWTAQNGEVIGTPSSPDGGWLLFKNPVQDVQMATSFRCAAGCQAGLLLRLEKTADGFKGVFVSISETPGAFAVTLDAQGRVLTKEPLERGGGTVRALAPPQPQGAPDAARAGGPGVAAPDVVVRWCRRRGARPAGAIAVHAARLRVPARRMEHARVHSRREHPSLVAQRRPGSRRGERTRRRPGRALRPRGTVRRRNHRSAIPRD